MACAEQSAVAVPSDEVKHRMDEEEAHNVRCRDGSRDDPETQKACDARDVDLKVIHSQGWCLEYDGQIGVEMKWVTCPPVPFYLPLHPVPRK
jgi:hypothetical protein